MSEPIQVGDVCLDLTQGRPVNVVEETGQTAAEWSEANDYALCENYGNSRLEATDDDAVFECVYCSSAKSEPSRTYAFPESRLLRIETEAGDDGRPVYERVVRDVLEQLFAVSGGEVQVDDGKVVIGSAARHAGFDTELVDEARELADVERTIGTEEVSADADD